MVAAGGPEAGFDALSVAPVPKDGSEAKKSGRRIVFRHGSKPGVPEDGLSGSVAVRMEFSCAVSSGCLPRARSSIMCALNYNAAAPRSIEPAPPGLPGLRAMPGAAASIENGEMAPTD